MSAGSLAGLTGIDKLVGVEAKVTLYLMLFLFGIAHSMQEVPVFIEVSLILDEMTEKNEVLARCRKERVTGQAYGILGIATGVGMTVGPLASGLIAAKCSTADAFLVNAVLSAVAMVPVLLTVGGYVRMRR